MTVQGNPFVYGRPIETAKDLADRGRELDDLAGLVHSGQAVMLYAPRRYGKTSLARVLTERLQRESDIPSVYADFWGASSMTDVVSVLGRAYASAPGAERIRRSLVALLSGLGFSVSLGGVVSVSRAARDSAEEDRAALRELLEVPRRIAARSVSGRALVVLDEFSELFNVPGEPDELMRSAFQASPEVSFLFMGSKRSLMTALFSDRHRPFYNFGRRMELDRLPYDELGDFVEEKFREAGGRVTPAAVDVLLGLTDGHPLRAQQLAHHTYRLSEPTREAAEETVFAALEDALDETGPEFRAILDAMTPARRAVYLAVCKEPTAEMHSRPYQRRHGIRSSGSLDSALRALSDSGDLELKEGRVPVPTDPLLAIWVRKRLTGGASGMA